MQPSPEDLLAHAMRAHASELTAFAKTRLVDDTELDDLMQELWTRFARTLRTETVNQPRAWLFRALRNALTDHYRHRAARPKLIALPPDELARRGEAFAPYTATDYSDVDGLDEAAFWAEVTAALDLLPAAQRVVFERNVIGGETLNAIAADLGIPIGTAISRKRYARERLQDLLRGAYTKFFADE